MLGKYFPVRENDRHQSKSVYYYMYSLHETANQLTVLRPDLRRVYWDSVEVLYKNFYKLLTPGYANKADKLMKEMNVQRNDQPADHVHALFKIGQYDDVVKYAAEFLPLVKEQEIRDRIKYFRARTFYERARFGNPSPSVLEKVKSARTELSNASSDMKGKYKRKVKKMERKLKKREREISKRLNVK